MPERKSGYDREKADKLSELEAKLIQVRKEIDHPTDTSPSTSILLAEYHKLDREIAALKGDDQ